MPEEERLTQEQLNQTLNALNYFEEFSSGYSSKMYGNPYGVQNRYYTPDLINQAIQSINNNPQVPTADSIVKALANPKSNEEILRNYATYFEINNIFYKRLLQFNTDLPAWNLTFDCINIEKDSDFNSKEFKNDLKVIDSFCSKLNFKDDLKDVVSQIYRQGVYYGVFRDEAEIYAFQELPPDFCKITGRSNIGALFSFNFAYFINNAGTNIDMFPGIFKKLLRKIYNQLGTEYNPAGRVDTRHSSFVYWIDVAPRDNFFCFTLDDGLMTLVPYYSALFPDMVLQPMMRDLEKNKAIIAAQKLLIGILETFDNAKSGTVNNQFKVDPREMGKFLAVARQGLHESIGITSLPVKNMQIADFNIEAQNRYTNYQRNISANAVSSSASLLTENKLNAFESELALTIDENFVKGLYRQFEKFLGYYINNRTKKFKFKFEFHDTNTAPDNQRRIDLFKEMSMMGLVDINQYARATNQNVFQAQRSLKLTKSFGLEKLLTPLMSLNNQTKDGATGRPTTPNSKNENTMASKENGSNDLKIN